MGRRRLEQHLQRYCMSSLISPLLQSLTISKPSTSTQSAAPRAQSPRSVPLSPMTSTLPPTTRPNTFQPPQPSRLSSSTVAGPAVTSVKFATGSQDLFSTQLTSSFSPPTSQLPSQKPVHPPKPNYNISLDPIPPTASSIPSQPPIFQSAFQPLQPTFQPLQPSAPSLSPASTSSQMPSMGGILTPSRPSQSSWNTSKRPSQNDWGDFDPLS